MKKKSITFNYVCNIIYEILGLFAPLITTPYVSRILGAEGIGTYSYTYSIAAYFAYFAALGSTVYGRREIAYLQDDRKKRSFIFWELILFRIILTLICLTTYCLYLYKNDFDAISAVQSLYVVAVVFDITWLFQGMENFGVVVLRNTIIKLAGILFIFLFVKSESDLLIYVLGLAGFPLLGSLILWTSVGSYIDSLWKINYKDLRPFNHFKGSFLLFIPTIASQVYLLLDKTMIGIFTTSSVENGYYEQAQKVVRICWTFVTTFSTVMFPRIAYIYSQNNKDVLREYMRKSFRFVWFLSIPLTFGLFSITSNLVPWFFGVEFEPVEALLYIFSFIIPPIGLGAVLGSQYFVAIGRQNWQTISILAGASINFALNIFLIPSFLSCGAAVASLIAEVLIAIIQIVTVTFILKDLKVEDIFYKFGVYFLSGVFMGVVVFLIGKQLDSTMINTLILVFIGIVIYCGMLLILRDDLFINILTSKFRRFKRK